MTALVAWTALVALTALTAFVALAALPAPALAAVRPVEAGFAGVAFLIGAFAAVRFGLPAAARGVLVAAT